MCWYVHGCEASEGLTGLQLGLFYATGDPGVVVKLVQGTEGWRTDVLAKEGNVDKFITSKVIRDALLILVLQHPLARDILGREVAFSQYAHRNA